MSMTDAAHALAPARGKTALVMAGGTGGHIFPGLAVAQALREKGWCVHWLGAPESMESRIVPPQGFAFESVAFGGVRGKGIKTLLSLPLRLLKAVAQSRALLQRVRPQVVVGMGGYITVPAGLAAALKGVPLILHEQNSVAGTANRVLMPLARRVFTAFPNVLATTASAADGRSGKVQWVGNPLRRAFLAQPDPVTRWQDRSGPLRVLVLGGSLGAQALNTTVPAALALLPQSHRPQVVHQSGAAHIDALRAAYAQAGVQAELLPFIDDTAQALAEADVVIGRAGASTVTELAAVGAAAVLVPFPHAVDDHQTSNARFLAAHDAAWLQPQNDFTPQWLAGFLQRITRAELLDKACKAKRCEKLHATEQIVAACEEVMA
ncbi:MAG: undecaprenyldiphospho-muramoylpentapeptide beta-N-acetylglucosaminyltransferase [Brachymonas sp.]|nr:undecaprenyldiphospho-muramoylpentapeptide beta-N-acetylglucosaminyltransferase [Brachymonas sp.]